MITIRFNARGLFKILVLVPFVTIILFVVLNGLKTQEEDIGCSEDQTRQNVKCPKIGRSIPPQSSEVIRVVCVSDTHGLHASVDVPAGDIFIHGGDFLDIFSKNWTSQVREFDAWLKKLPHQHKIFVPGNHDIIMDPILRYGGLITETPLLENAYILAGDHSTVEGLTIAGFPYTPVPPDKKKSWPYGVENEDQMANNLVRLPATDIFVSHNAPWSIGSFNPVSGREEGSRAVLEHVVRTKPKLHVFGHTHEGHGVYRYKEEQTVFINVAQKWKGANAAIVVDLRKISMEVEGVYMKTNFRKYLWRL